MWEWITANETLAWWLGMGSVATFLVTLIAVPIAIVRLPADYFVKPGQHRVVARNRHPLIRMCWRVGKAVLGVTLIIMGILMLVLPGQGIITILIGIMLLNFPGRRRLQYWIVSRHRILSSINWLRRRADREPLRMKA